jgi:carboxyl-terminal processing protease
MKVVPGVLALIGLAGVLAACVRPFPPELQPESHRDISKVLANAYEEISEDYVERVTVAELAVAGLEGLAALESAFSVDSSTESVSLKLRDSEVHSFAPPPADDVDAWADAVADTLIAAQARPSALMTRAGKQVLEAYMRGIAGGLSRPAHYSTAEESRAHWFPEYDSGVNFSFRGHKEGLELWRLDPDGHLESAGLRRGDILTHIDSESIKGLTLRQMSERSAGPEGSIVTLTVLRGDPSSELHFPVARWKQEFASFNMARRDGVDIITMPYLNARSSYELTRQLSTELRKARYGEIELKGLVLDLRGNLGGNELVAADLANAFLGKGVIFTWRDYRSEPKEVVNASWPDTSENLPLIVLVDGFTGFGAEEVVAALQDNGRAVVIGSSTAGEGVVYHNVSLFNMGHVTMPVAFSHAPSGYGLARRGVLPHICTSVAGAKFDELMAALRRGEGLTGSAARHRHVDPEDEEAIAAQRALCPAEPDEGDLAVRLAVSILEDSALYARIVVDRGL